MPSETTVRDATESDVPAVLDIYNHYVLNSIATFDIEPQSLDDRLRWFRETRPPHRIFVAEDADAVVGFASLRPFRTRAAYRFTAEDSVYLHPEHCGRGLGSRLLRQALEAAAEGGFHTVIAGVSLPNEASMRLHQSAGFTLVGIEREVGYKFERWIDVAWLQRML